jgi:hypothetical protein
MSGSDMQGAKVHFRSDRPCAPPNCSCCAFRAGPVVRAVVSPLSPCSTFRARYCCPLLCSAPAARAAAAPSGLTRRRPALQRLPHAPPQTAASPGPACHRRSLSVPIAPMCDPRCTRRSTPAAPSVLAAAASSARTRAIPPCS